VKNRASLLGSRTMNAGAFTLTVMAVLIAFASSFYPKEENADIS